MSKLYSIGEVAQRTGLSVLRLRAWENRYGEPGAAQDFPSTHRRYDQSQVDRLCLLAHLIEKGHRIGALTKLTDTQLRELSDQGGASVKEHVSLPDLWLWRQALQKSNVAEIQSILQELYHQNSCAEFLDHRLGPMLGAMGHWWAVGEISITQEHIASAVIESFLSQQRLVLNPSPKASNLLFCTLPMEQHTLGLQMAALLAASEGYKVIYAGRRIPRAEIALAACHYQALGVCLSFSISADPVYSRSELKELRKELPETTEILCGGAGVPEHLDQIHVFKTFTEFMYSLKGFQE